MSHKLLAQLERQRKEREQREEAEKARAQFKATEALNSEDRARKLREESAARKEALLIERVSLGLGLGLGLGLLLLLNNII